MTVKCTFCNDTKQEPGIPGPCVWCEQVGAAPVAVGYQFAKGFTDPVGDCENFEAGIHVNAWFQRIVVYGHSPEDAEKLRDCVMSYVESCVSSYDESKECKLFEAFWKENMNTAKMDLHKNIYPMNSGWSYSCHETNRSWKAWQACAQSRTRSAG